MKIGISSWTYPWAVGIDGQTMPSRLLDVFQMVEIAFQSGVAVLQFADNLPLHKLAASELNDLASFARDAGITIEVGTKGIEPEHIRHYIQIAKTLKASLIRTLVPREKPTAGIEPVVKTLESLLPDLEENGIVLAIENYEAFRSREYSEIVRALSSPHVGICLDTINNMGIGESISEIVGELSPYVVNLHVKDFRVRRLESRMGFVIEGAPAGEGLLDLPHILMELQRHGRNPNVILEQWPPFQGSLEETLILEKKWADQGIHYLLNNVAGVVTTESLRE